MIRANGRLFKSLREVQDAARAGMWPEVEVDATGALIEEPGTSWTLNVPLTIKGGIWSGPTHRHHGWWLSWRVPQALILDGVTVRRFKVGGVDAGCDAGRSRVAARRCSFSYMGSAQPGYAAIFATDSDVAVTGCRFYGLTNPGEQGRLMHAVYLAHGSRGAITDCRFHRISGDPVRVRDDSTVVVEGCSSVRAGWQAMASSWRQADEADSAILLAGGNDPGTTFSGGDAAASRAVPVAGRSTQRSLESDASSPTNPVGGSA